MKSTRLLLLVFAIALGAPAFSPAAFGAAAQKGEEGGKRQNPERALTQLIRGMQMDLESSSSRGFLSAIDSAKFDDYPRFEQMIEDLLRENSLRVYFRQDSTSVRDNSAQVIIDAEMEMTRKQAAGQAQQRRQQITVDFEFTNRGWKIINITPRDFFRPQ